MSQLNNDTHYQTDEEVRTTFTSLIAEAMNHIQVPAVPEVTAITEQEIHDMIFPSYTPGFPI